MIRWAIGTSLQLQYLVIIIAAVLMFFGIGQIQEMPTDVYPEFNPTLVEVQTEALGLSSIEMESLITVPLEADLLNGVAWVEEIYSETVNGLSSVLLVFEPGTDPIDARQMVQERLTQTFALPNVSTPPLMLNPLSTSSRVMMVGLSSDDISLIDMSVLARWNIKPRLMGVQGVANVAIWGQREWQLQVQVDPERLASNDVDLQQIVETTGEAMWVSPLPYLESSTPGTAGWIDTPNQRLGVQHLLPISAAADLAKVSIIGAEDLVLGDVTNVVEDHQQLIGDALLDDGPGLILVIEKFPNANTLEVTRAVEDVLDEMSPGLGGIDIDTTIFRPANYLDESFSNLWNIARVGIILVALVLVAFYFGWRTTVISLIVIPLTLVLALFVLHLRGETFNIMLLAGLATALVVVIDNAIIDVHHIARRLSESKQNGEEESRITIIENAALEMREPLWFATLIVLLIVAPMLFLAGTTGAFLHPFVVSFIFALLTSLVVGLIVTPALCLVLLGDEPLNDNGSPLANTLRGGYQALATPFLASPNLAVIVVIVLAIVGVFSIVTFDEEYLPTLKQTNLRIQWDGAPSISRDAMIRVTERATAELQQTPGILNVGSHVGRAITGDAIVGINSGEIWLSVDPEANYDDTLAAVETIINGYPGLFRTVDAYQPRRIDEVLSRPDEDIVLRVYGHSFDELATLAQTINDGIVDIDGLTDLEIQSFVNEPQIEIEVDLQAAERYQTKPGDVRRAATTLLSGLTVGNLYQGQKVFEVVVWGAPELRDSLSDIQELLIDVPSGQVPLSELADIRIVPSPTVIRRDSVQRFIDITGNVSGRDVDSVISDIEAALGDVTFPLEYHASVLDAVEQQGNGIQSQLLVLVAIMIGAFLLIQATFNSWRLALITMITLPIALVGGLIAILLSGGVLSLSALFGLLGILVFAIRNSLIMNSRIIELASNHQELSEEELILAGVQERLIPILMTALAVLVASLPVVFSGSIAGIEILHPMAIAIIGGLITTVLLDLFILPALYLRFAADTIKRVE